MGPTTIMILIMMVLLWRRTLGNGDTVEVRLEGVDEGDGDVQLLEGEHRQRRAVLAGVSPRGLGRERARRVGVLRGGGVS